MAKITSKDLIGKKYKVFNTNKHVVGYKTIKKAWETDSAAFFIVLDKKTDNGIILSYKSATDLVAEQKQIKGFEF